MRPLTRHPRPALAGALLAAAALALPLSSHAAPKSRPPHVTTGLALHAGETTVALQGTVNPHGQEATCWFQYGTTTAYGGQTPTTPVGTGTVGVKVNQPLTGLQPGTTYHYRLVAMSAAGTMDGQDRTFTTRRVPLKFLLPRVARTVTYGTPFSLTGTLSGTGGADRQVVLQTSYYPFVRGFYDTAGPVSTNAEGGFTFRVPSVSQSIQLRVRTLETVPTYSPTVTVRVAVRVTLTARPAGSGLVRLSGTVSPAEAGAPVVFQLLRPGRSPLKVGSTVVRRAGASTSRFSETVSVRHAGSYRALVKVSNGQQVSGASGTVFLRAAPRVRRGRR